ncbi:MAG: sulfatase-like hydrolase/transferase [Bryobacteraceae bacterium]|nr:sulfatase-like hydrolase/transferase [Bryobacteraceae bacterium]
MSGITRRSFLAAAGAAGSAPRRPNVVMFMTDDHGAWALGSYGCNDLRTPNIDRLASGGARFTRAFACTPVCSPSRMTYFTGRLPSRHGVQDWLRPEDSFGEKTRRWLDGHPTFSEVLARNGYRLGMSGKWHMGDDENAQAGFSWWNTVPGGGGPYRDPEFVKNGRRAKVAGYKTDIVTGGALEFLDSVRNDPFFLYVPYYAPHTPFDYQPETYRAPYAQAAFSCFPDAPPHPWQNPGLKEHHGNRASKLAYSALITGVDHNVGRIVSRLQERGLRDNTLIVFTADQGWNAGHHGVWGKGNGTWPFNMYEESLHVPLIWNLPNAIRPGRVLTPMVSSYDFFPTILDYLGIDAPRDPVRVGRSYAAFLRGDAPATPNRLYFEYSFVRAVRTENLKYVQRTKEWPSELYDLETDPGETRNVIADRAYRKPLDALRRDLDRFFAEAGAPPIEQWRATTEQQLTVYNR